MMNIDFNVRKVTCNCSDFIV